MSFAPRPAWAEIDLGAIRANVRGIAARLTGGARVCAVVKANAYGHGDVEVSRAALDAGATSCAVILVDEALRLREAGIEAPVLLLHEAPAHRVADAIANDVTPVVFTRAGIEAAGDAAERADRTVKVHLKLDTGLNRLGCPPDQLDDIVAALTKERRLEIEAVFTHFAFADDPANPAIDVQLERFADMCDRLRRHGVAWSFRHAANSAAAMTRPDAHFDMVRLGVAMYGLLPGPKLAGILDLEPALTLKARAAQVKRVPAGEAVSYGHRYRLARDGWIVSVPLGYADGWARGLGSNAHVLVGGTRYPAVGTVCMDSFMADLGDDPCSVGDEITLIGRQGKEQITADEIAAALGTINYEVVTRISSRIPRVFHG